MSIDPDRSANTSTARKVGVDLKSKLPLYYGLHFDEREQKKHSSDSEEEEEEEEDDLLETVHHDLMIPHPRRDILHSRSVQLCSAGWQKYFSF